MAIRQWTLGSDRRTHPQGRSHFEVVRADLERRLRKIYGAEWPRGLEEVITRIVRARVRDTFGLVGSR